MRNGSFDCFVNDGPKLCATHALDMAVVDPVHVRGVPMRREPTGLNHRVQQPVVQACEQEQAIWRCRRRKGEWRYDLVELLGSCVQGAERIAVTHCLWRLPSKELGKVHCRNETYNGAKGFFEPCYDRGYVSAQR